MEGKDWAAPTPQLPTPGPSPALLLLLCLPLCVSTMLPRDGCLWFLVWQRGELERGRECMTVSGRNVKGGLWVPSAFALEENVMALYGWSYYACTSMQKTMELSGPTALHFRGLSQVRGLCPLSPCMMVQVFPTQALMGLSANGP